MLEPSRPFRFLALVDEHREDREVVITIHVHEVDLCGREIALDGVLRWRVEMKLLKSIPPPAVLDGAGVRDRELKGCLSFAAEHQ